MLQVTYAWWHCQQQRNVSTAPSAFQLTHQMVKKEKNVTHSCLSEYPQKNPKTKHFYQVQAAECFCCCFACCVTHITGTNTANSANISDWRDLCWLTEPPGAVPWRDSKRLSEQESLLKNLRGYISGQAQYYFFNIIQRSSFKMTKTKGLPGVFGSADMLKFETVLVRKTTALFIQIATYVFP